MEGLQSPWMTTIIIFGVIVFIVAAIMVGKEDADKLPDCFSAIWLVAMLSCQDENPHSLGLVVWVSATIVTDDQRPAPF